MILLGLAAFSALPALRRSRLFSDTGLIIIGIIGSLWIALRALLNAPVAELAAADALLLASAVIAFVAARVIGDDKAATRIFFWGLWFLMAASIYLIVRQIGDGSYNLVYPVRPGAYPSGFFGHYNDGANFLIGSSFLLAGAGLFGSDIRGVRWLWGLTALAGLASIHFTHSRGGLLAAAIAAGVFSIFVLIHTKRQHPKWFAPMVIGLPVVGLLIVGLLFQGWMAAQSVRSESTEIGQVMNNTIRLHLWGIAFSCIALHPWAGGGSRSYSWECYRFWDFNAHGWQQLRPEYPHNEFLQVVTDYGMVGGLLVVALITAIVIRALIRTFQTESANGDKTRAIAYGGLAALCGILIQASFNFVFHLLPGAILLGFILGQSSMPRICLKTASDPLKQGARFVLMVLTASAAAFTMFYGVKGTRVMYLLSPVIFRSSDEATLEKRIEATEDAVRIWPQASLYKDLAYDLHRSSREDLLMHLFTPRVERSIAAYRAGLALHPFDLALSVNLADLLDHVDRDEEATAEYQRTIRLQGGMEMGFGGHRKFAGHLAKVGNRRLADGDFTAAFETFASAYDQYQKTVEASPAYPTTAEAKSLLSSILDGLGRAAERSGDLEGALDYYHRLASAGSGLGNYRMGMLVGKMARTAYSERRPSEAYSLFLQAKQNLSTKLVLPRGVPSREVEEELAYCTKMIDFFVATKVPAAEKPAR